MSSTTNQQGRFGKLASWRFGNENHEFVDGVEGSRSETPVDAEKMGISSLNVVKL